MIRYSRRFGSWPAFSPQARTPWAAIAAGRRNLNASRLSVKARQPVGPL